MLLHTCSQPRSTDTSMYNLGQCIQYKGHTALLCGPYHGYSLLILQCTTSANECGYFLPKWWFNQILKRCLFALVESRYKWNHAKQTIFGPLVCLSLPRHMLNITRVFNCSDLTTSALGPNISLSTTHIYENVKLHRNSATMYINCEILQIYWMKK